MFRWSDLFNYPGRGHIIPHDPIVRSLSLVLCTTTVTSMQSAHNNSYRIGKIAQRTPTCSTCKSRHQKCSGEKPACSNCTLRGIACTYTVSAPALKAKALLTPTLPEPLSARSTISEAEYNKLYSEIFGDIVGLSSTTRIMTGLAQISTASSFQSE